MLVFTCSGHLPSSLLCTGNCLPISYGASRSVSPITCGGKGWPQVSSLALGAFGLSVVCSHDGLGPSRAFHDGVKERERAGKAREGE